MKELIDKYTVLYLFDICNGDFSEFRNKIENLPADNSIERIRKFVISTKASTILNIGRFEFDEEDKIFEIIVEEFAEVLKFIDDEVLK